MENIKIELSKSEMEYIQVLLLDDILRIRKKLEKDIDDNNKDAILKDFKNSVTNNSIQVKMRYVER